MVFEYIEGGNFSDWIDKNYNNFDWAKRINKLHNIINSLNEIHERKMVHRDLHTGNILFDINIKFSRRSLPFDAHISDMGLCGEVDNIDSTKIYGVMPYVAPEVLRGNPYTEAADIYSFGMIMYFVATGQQPFANCAHDY